VRPAHAERPQESQSLGPHTLGPVSGSGAARAGAAGIAAVAKLSEAAAAAASATNAAGSSSAGPRMMRRTAGMMGAVNGGGTQ
jgi:hypothetical protein